jgi:hypothetical protein
MHKAAYGGIHNPPDTALNFAAGALQLELTQMRSTVK